MSSPATCGWTRAAIFVGGIGSRGTDGKRSGGGGPGTLLVLTFMFVERPCFVHVFCRTCVVLERRVFC